MERRKSCRAWHGSFFHAAGISFEEVSYQSSDGIKSIHQIVDAGHDKRLKIRRKMAKDICNGPIRRQTRCIPNHHV